MRKNAIKYGLCSVDNFSQYVIFGQHYSRHLFAVVEYTRACSVSVIFFYTKEIIVFNKVTSLYFILGIFGRKKKEVKVLRKSKILRQQAVDQVSYTIFLDNTNSIVEVRITKMDSSLVLLLSSFSRPFLAYLSITWNARSENCYIYSVRDKTDGKLSHKTFHEFFLAIKPWP